MKSSAPELFRELPSVDALLNSAAVAQMIAEYGRPAVTSAVRAVLSNLRDMIAAGDLNADGIRLATENIGDAVGRQLRQALQYSLRPVINATGVILHTNLGRAPLAASTLAHIAEIVTQYSNLEFDIAAGERGKRDVHVDRLFRQLLSEDQNPSDVSTIVVNNNAAAVLLSLNTLAEGGEVVVSRGELVEIGGSFRIPDVMQKSQATLREVGTTNRTRVADYERAINDKTRLLLRVHRSNFEIRGFTEQPSLDELVGLARAKSLPLLEDLGSGALFDLRTVGVSGEAGVLDSLRAGVDIVTYSGDKLLGGPQAGLISGRKDLVKNMRGNSLFRALRADKMTYAALESTLLAYVKRDYSALPAVAMMQLGQEDVRRRAEALARGITNPSLLAEVLEGESVIGGGSAPSAVLPTILVALTSSALSADQLSAALRASEPPIITRVEDGRILLDLRTVLAQQDDTILSVLQQLP